MKYGNSLVHFSSEFVIIKNWECFDDRIKVNFQRYNIISDNEYDISNEIIIEFSYYVLESDIRVVKLYIKNSIRYYLYEFNHGGLIKELELQTNVLEKINNKKNDVKKKYNENYLEDKLNSLDREYNNEYIKYCEINNHIDKLRKILDRSFSRLRISDYEERFYIDHHCDYFTVYFEQYEFYKEKNI